MDISNADRLGFSEVELVQIVGADSCGQCETIDGGQRPPFSLHIELRF